jgi:uncharacterized membrane protein
MAKGRTGGSQPPPKRPGDDVVSPRKEGEREVYIEHQSIMWSAPMPPPEIVRGYNDAVENGGERVFNQFEIEADHRRSMQWRGQTFAFIVAISGRVCALIFSLAFLGIAWRALEKGESWVAAASLVGSLALVVGAFTGIPNIIKQRLQQPKSMQEK